MFDDGASQVWYTSYSSITFLGPGSWEVGDPGLETPPGSGTMMLLDVNEDTLKAVAGCGALGVLTVMVTDATLPVPTPFVAR